MTRTLDRNFYKCTLQLAEAETNEGTENNSSIIVRSNSAPKTINVAARVPSILSLVSVFPNCVSSLPRSDELCRSVRETQKVGRESPGTVVVATRTNKKPCLLDTAFDKQAAQKPRTRSVCIIDSRDTSAGCN